MLKHKALFILAVAAAILTPISAIINTQSDSLNNNAQRVVIIKLNGLQAKKTLLDVTFSVTLSSGQASFNNTANIGAISSGKVINSTLRVAIPSHAEDLNFSVSLSTNNSTLFEASGLLNLVSMDSSYTFLYINPSALKSTDGAELVFASIGILGSITVKMSTYSNVTGPFTATLSWKNQSYVIESSQPVFTFQNVSSGLPEIPFQINVSTIQAKNILFAIGELQITSEKISMPFSTNIWSNRYILAWNITFICSEYATELRLPIAVSGKSSKVINVPRIYTGEFKQMSTLEAKASESASSASESGLLETIIRLLFTPTFLALVATLAIIIALIILIKLRK